MYETNPYFYGTGRRKESVARVRLYAGTGKITINDRDIDDYFGLETLKLIVRQPLVLTGTADKYDVVCRVAAAAPELRFSIIFERLQAVKSFLCLFSPTKLRILCL